MCPDCNNNTGSYTMKCIGCMARWVLRFDKCKRIEMINTNGRHDIEELKKEVVKQAKRGL